MSKSTNTHTLREPISQDLIAFAKTAALVEAEPFMILLAPKRHSVALSPATADLLGEPQIWTWLPLDVLRSRLDELSNLALAEQTDSALRSQSAPLVKLRVDFRGDTCVWLEGKIVALPKGLVEEDVVAGTFNDVTATVQELEIKQAIADEMVHRVKNTITMAHALSNITIRECSNMEDFQLKFGRRLLALAGVDALVVTDAVARIDLNEVLKRVLAILPGPYRARLKIESQSLFVSRRFAQSFALAINELGTNAIKHGSLGHDDGSVHISIRQIDEDENYVFHWVECSDHPIAEIGPSSAGSQLLTAMMENSGATRVKLDYSGGHLDYSFELPPAVYAEI